MSLFLDMLFSQWPFGIAWAGFCLSIVLAGQSRLVGDRMSGAAWLALTIGGIAISAMSIFAVCDAAQRHVRMEHELLAFALMMPLFAFTWVVFSWSAWRGEPAIITS